MKHYLFLLIILTSQGLVAQVKQAQNPVIFADVPDMSMVRVGRVYYMSSTTMHLSPGVPIMKSTDLVNWKLVSYVYDTLGDVDALHLKNGANAYGRGSWASCLIYVDEEKLVSEDNTNKWNQSKFQEIEYPIPDAMLQGKKDIRIKFQSLPHNTAGAVYYIRLLRNK